MSVRTLVGDLTSGRQNSIFKVKNLVILLNAGITKIIVVNEDCQKILSSTNGEGRCHGCEI